MQVQRDKSYSIVMMIFLELHTTNLLREYVDKMVKRTIGGVPSHTGIFTRNIILSSLLFIVLRWGESLTINLKTAQNFLKTKFPSGQQKMLQKKAQWQMNQVIDGIPYM